MLPYGIQMMLLMYYYIKNLGQTYEARAHNPVIDGIFWVTIFLCNLWLFYLEFSQFITNMLGYI